MRLPSWTAGLAGCGGLLLITLAVGAGGVWWFGVRPHFTPPRPAEAIEQDWARVGQYLPEQAPYRPVDPAVVALLEGTANTERATTEQVDLLRDWIEDDGQIDRPGCSMLHSLQGGDPFSTMAVFSSSVTLRDRGYPEHQAMLGAAVIDHNLMGLMVGTAILADAKTQSSVQGLQPHVAKLFDALSREAACGDLVLEGLIDGTIKDNSLGPGSTAYLEVERLRYRDFYSRLLLAMHPVRHDASALKGVMASFDQEIPNSTVANLLISGTATLGSDYLTQLESP